MGSRRVPILDSVKVRPSKAKRVSRMQRDDATRDRDVDKQLRELDWKRREHEARLVAKRRAIIGRPEGWFPRETINRIDEEWSRRISDQAKLLREGKSIRANVATCAPIETDNTCGSPYFVETEETQVVKNKYRLLDKLRGLSTSERTRVCGRLRISPEVQLQARDGRLSVVGTACCGNIHGCPVCAGKVYSKRMVDIDTCVERWIGYGENRIGPSSAWSGMLTTTIRHGYGADLAETRRGISRAWRRVFQGSAGQSLKERLHLAHYVRGNEQTFGEKNGWHPHTHSILLCNVKPTYEAMQEFAIRWSDCVARELGESFRPDIKLRPTEKNGVLYLSPGVECHELTTSRDGRYLAKMGFEVTGGIDTKEASSGNRTYWQVAKDAADGDRESIKVWQSAQRALKGTKQLTWSVGTKAKFDLLDLDDEAIVAEQEDGEIITDENGQPATKGTNLELVIVAQKWDEACRRDRYFVSRLHAAAKNAYAFGDWTELLVLLGRSSPMSSSGLVSTVETDSFESLTTVCSKVTPSMFRRNANVDA